MNALRLTLLSVALGATAASAQPVAQPTSDPAVVQTQSVFDSDITTAYPNQRPPDQRGLHVFEAPKAVSRLAGDTPRLRVGAAFTQQFQALRHENTATPNWIQRPGSTVPGDTVNTRGLIDIGPGFNLATANLTLNALLADGVQVNLDAYLSSRHHPETWVKGGYLQVDDLGFLGVPALDRIMRYTTIRAGHYEINYGDAHFRRSDNGQALYNPFVENLLMDAFTTEIGGEVLVRYGGALALVGVTGGEIQGGVVNPDGRSLAVLSKLGYDAMVMPDLRMRLTGSVYHNGNAIGSTLYAGDRAGSRYYMALENPLATTAAQFTSGRVNPGFREAVTAFMVNPFVKWRGAELFGTYERATGRMANESEDVGRVWQQVAVEGLYRFLPREQVFVGARYNVASGALVGPVQAGQVTTAGPDVSVNRLAVSAGWFPTRNVLVKAEYVNQTYNDFPALDIRNGGRINGFMLEGVVSF